MTAAVREGEARPRLATLQRWLFERVTSASVAPLGAAGRRIRPGGLCAAARLEVYRHGYFARLIECLTDDYPAVAHALGAASFEALCRAYIEAHPPRSASLNFYGASFADFCQRRSVALELAANIARLEWAVVSAIHADATRTLDPAELGTLDECDWARARLVPSASLTIVTGDYPVYDYYQAFSMGERPGLPEREPSALAVCRRDDDVWRLRLSAPLANLLGRLAAGERLAAALDAVSGPDAAGDLGAGTLQHAFGEWVACGCFAALALD
jgi:hypothetical protein